jgi:hypothetical protein
MFTELKLRILINNSIVKTLFNKNINLKNKFLLFIVKHNICEKRMKHYSKKQNKWLTMVKYNNGKNNLNLIVKFIYIILLWNLSISFALYTKVK